MSKEVEFKDLVGKTITSIKGEVGGDEITIEADGRAFKLYHSQDCCEDVHIESIVGDLQDLVGEPLLVAEESTSQEIETSNQRGEYPTESFTYTFYKLATRKGYVDIRWYGSSNGYYSERVSFVEVVA